MDTLTFRLVIARLRRGVSDFVRLHVATRGQSHGRQAIVLCAALLVSLLLK